MKFEHFALNVLDPRSMRVWYVEHFGLRIARALPEAPFTTFLADSSGRTVMELYTNTQALIPDYASVHPRSFHVAFVAEDPKTTAEKLVAAGATPAYEERSEDGSIFVMLRDPWGVPIQLVKRATPLGA